jgi:hypothetical protein
MTLVPNRIWIPTHEGDLEHHGLCMEERRQESPIKKRRKKGEKE